MQQLLQPKLSRLANFWPKNVKNRSDIQLIDWLLMQSADSKISTVSLRQEVPEIWGIALVASPTEARMKKSAFKRHFGLRPALTQCARPTLFTMSDSPTARDTNELHILWSVVDACLNWGRQPALEHHLRRVWVLFSAASGLAHFGEVQVLFVSSVTLCGLATAHASTQASVG